MTERPDDDPPSGRDDRSTVPGAGAPPTNAPADAAPELVESPAVDGDDGHPAGPLPKVPDYAEDGDVGPAVQGVHEPPELPEGDLKPIRYRPADAAEGSESRHDTTEDSDPRHVGAETADGDACAAAACTCGERTVADGGTGAANVDADGRLTDLEFTPPATDVSQPLEGADAEPPDRRVGVPDGADLDTPGYGIRARMSDIEEPEEKTWFMELDHAVIDADRCIQCGTCVAACPSDSIGIGDDDLPELVKMCTGCSLCWDFCPRGGLRYERQWKITGGEDNVTGAGDPITEFSARAERDWTDDAQDGGLVTTVLIHLLEAGEIHGALVATESEAEPWKAEPFLATTPEELVENAGSIYNQTMALGALSLDDWTEKLPDVDHAELSLALVGTPCEIEGIRALQDFEPGYGAQEELVHAVEYTVALMCTKNFNYYRLFGEQLEQKRGIDPADVGKMDVLHGKLLVYDHDGDLLVEEDVEHFHDAALKGCDECADFSGYCADLTVGSVGSSDEYSSVVVRTERGLKAWELTEPDLDYHDLEDRSAIGKLQGWDKKNAFESLERPFDPDAPRFIEYTEHAENYGTLTRVHETDH